MITYSLEEIELSILRTIGLPPAMFNNVDDYKMCHSNGEARVRQIKRNRAARGYAKQRKVFVK